MASQRTARTEYRVEHNKVKWDPTTMEIRTHSVEKALEPLVQQVSTGALFQNFTVFSVSIARSTSRMFEIYYAVLF